MRLKRIELAGFKSFVDPTKIDMGDGITSIVGPNGSGKSNIVDAIRWVLGEHSAKHLRGGVMDDLIFQGSDTRPPVGVCDVELTFAIQEGQLQPPYHELEEIRVRRRLTREGGSDAFINGKMVRLKDIVDLFLDTGISTRAYAIVEQGSIARMITSKPEERRLMLEEAAGIMKYRSRRREAERKMNDTRQNLERATDLLDEVRTQCRSLKQQASRAARFKELQDEFQEMQATSMGIRYGQSRQRCREIEQQLNEAKTREAEAAKHHAEAERKLTEAREHLARHEPEAQTMQDALRAAEQKRAGLQQQAERMAGERRLLNERRAMLEQRIDDAGQRIEQLEKDIAELERRATAQDSTELEKAQAEAHSRMQQAQEAYSAESRERDRLLAELEHIKSTLASAERRKEQAQINLQRLNDRREQLEKNHRELQEQQQKAKTELARLEQEATKAAERKQLAEAALEAAQESLDKRRNEREAAASSMAEQEGEVRRLRGDIEELRARLSNRDVPDELRTELRERGMIWVDESLQVPDGLELAVAAALRGQAADAKLPANPGLKELRERLNKLQDTPVAFFTEQSAATTPISDSLADHIDMEKDHPLYGLFARVVLVEDILQAPDALASQPACTSAVSRDGWRMEAAGWLVPPSHKHTARRLATQRRLKQREQELETAEKVLTKLRNGFEQSETNLAAQQQAWQKAHLAATETESQRQSQQAHFSRQETELEAAEGRLERIRSELGELEGECEHWSSQLSEKEELPDDQIQTAEQALNAQTDKQEKAAQQLNQARNELAAAEQALALQKQAAEAIASDRKRLHDERTRLTTQIETDTAKQKESEAALQQAEQQSDMDESLREASNTVEQTHQALNHLRQQGHQLQQAMHEADRHEHQQRASQQQLAEMRQQREVKLAAEQARLQDLAEEIQQRCQRSADELLHALEQMDEAPDPDATVARAQALEERLARFGPVNLLAIEEYEQAHEREQFLAGQVDDLNASLQTLENTITRIDRTTKQRFQDTFERTNAYFKQTFPRLFGGGRGELRLDSDDLLDAGVEVVAQPPGKRLQDVSLLSGGEKALTAVALVFSIFRIKPAPFCILDEVDAPLDDANVGRFGEMVQELAEEVQFLAITHNKVSMQSADRIVGVSMPEPGVSRIVSVDLEAMDAAQTNA